MKIGKGCRIYIHEFGSEPFLIEIGNKVTITAGVRLLTHNGSTWLIEDSAKGRRYDHRPIKIGSHVFIGIDSIICPGVCIEDRVIIGAGSVVTKSIPANSVVAGVPARIIGSYDKYEQEALTNFVSDKDLNQTSDFRSRIDTSIKLSNRGFNSYLKK